MTRQFKEVYISEVVLKFQDFDSDLMDRIGKIFLSNEETSTENKLFIVCFWSQCKKLLDFSSHN